MWILNPIEMTIYLMGYKNPSGVIVSVDFLLINLFNLYERIEWIEMGIEGA